MTARRTRQLHVLAALAIAVAASRAAAQEDAPPAPTHFKGREIARTMHYSGAPWLTRDSREREEECATLLGTLDVEPGDVVCDLGCGNGFYTLRLADRVGPGGRVLAVDIQPEMLDLLRERAAITGLAERIEPILGTLTDPRLPDAAVDLVLLVDVYHELSHPAEILAAVRKCLKPDGRVALVEFRAEDPEVPIKPLHKMSRRQILKEIPPAGFRLVGEFDGLPWQHVMFFERTLGTTLEREAAAALERACVFMRTQPPGTAAMGGIYLRLFALSGDERYLEDAERAGRRFGDDRANDGNPAPGRAAQVALAAEMIGRVRQVIDALDEQGRWLTDGRPDPVTWLENTSLLCRYLELPKPEPGPTPKPTPAP